MSTSYNRVFPRDFIYEGVFLQSLGNLSKALDVPYYKFSIEDEGQAPAISQDEDGNLTVSNMTFSVGGNEFVPYSGMNCDTPNSLFASFEIDGEERVVYLLDDDASLSDEFKEVLNDLGLKKKPLPEFKAD